MKRKNPVNWGKQENKLTFSAMERYKYKAINVFKATMR